MAFMVSCLEHAAVVDSLAVLRLTILAPIWLDVQSPCQ